MTVEERGEALVRSGLVAGDVDAREPQWIGLACAVGGVFVRAQYEVWSGRGRVASLRLVRRLVDARLAGVVDGGRGIGRYVHLRSRRLYRALGMGDSRHRRTTSSGHLLQRLLALDYVAGRETDPGWLFGNEQAAAFRAAGAPDTVLPQRSYRARGGGGRTTVLFPARWPLALQEGRALFVLPDSGEAARPALELRTWGRQHARLWDWLRREGGRAEVVFAARSVARASSVRKELQRWVDSGVPPRGGPGGRPGSGRDPADEIARIERLVRAAELERLAREYGSVAAALARRKTLLQPSPGAPPLARVHAAGTWLSRRLAGRSAVRGREDGGSDLVLEPAATQPR